MARDTFNLLRTSQTFRERVKYTTGFQTMDGFKAARLGLETAHLLGIARLDEDLRTVGQDGAQHAVGGLKLESHFEFDGHG